MLVFYSTSIADYKLIVYVAASCICVIFGTSTYKLNGISVNGIVTHECNPTCRDPNFFLPTGTQIPRTEIPLKSSRVRVDEKQAFQ